MIICPPCKNKTHKCFGLTCECDCAADIGAEFRCKWCGSLFKKKDIGEKHAVICGMEFDVK